MATHPGYAAQEVPHPLRAPALEVDARGAAFRRRLARGARGILRHAGRRSGLDLRDGTGQERGAAARDLVVEVRPGSAP